MIGGVAAAFVQSLLRQRGPRLDLRARLRSRRNGPLIPVTVVSIPLNVVPQEDATAGVTAVGVALRIGVVPLDTLGGFAAGAPHGG
jgi:hypothetical protein